MEEILISGLQGVSRLLIDEKLSNIGNYIPTLGVYIITDKNVFAHLGKGFPNFPTFITEPGEGSKSLVEVHKVSRWLLENGADRSSFILGIGGGVVCDLAGFVASTFMRGVDFGFVATSLLAQVDASVGGKNGVNVDGYKNIVGTFIQPKFVVCDIDTLTSLPKEEFTNGLAEIVKHTLIADGKMFSHLEEKVEAIKNKDLTLLRELVAHSVKIKANIVGRDEREKGDRKKLNLGHTWGHAVEKESGLPHGKSVSIGLEFAARFSMHKGMLVHRDYMRIINLLRDLELPICTTLSPNRVFDALQMDKKKTADYIDFIFMQGIGNSIVERISISEIKSFIEKR